MSKESDDFVGNLKASLGYMAPETEKFYKAKLANWKLTREQWGRALDSIIECNVDGKLPQLSSIYAELRSIQSAARDSSLGIMSFDWRGLSWAIIVQAFNGSWLSRKTMRKPQPPAGATNIQVHPMNAVQEYREEAPENEPEQFTETKIELAQQMGF